MLRANPGHAPVHLRPPRAEKTSPATTFVPCMSHCPAFGKLFRHFTIYPRWSGAPAEAISRRPTDPGAPPEPAQRHACHAKWRSVSPSATPAMQSEGRCHQVPRPVRYQRQPSAISATPATQSEGRCHQVPRLPRRVKVDVTKCHACYAKSRGARQTQAHPQSQCSAIGATPATQSPAVPATPKRATKGSSVP